MLAGEIVECDAAQAVYERPQHLYTKALLEARPGFAAMATESGSDVH
jgi:ABC-type dipeptide/oligopeptide/nickel transport system ATPase component